jgi:hypothetical protein
MEKTLKIKPKATIFEIEGFQLKIMIFLYIVFTSELNLQKVFQEEKSDN